MSPALHNWGFAHAAIAGVYMAWPLPPEKLSAFFVAVRTLPVRGGNITLPHKVSSLAHLDKISPRAALVGAANTFYWKNELLCGDNTEVAGFLAPINGQRFSSALVLGAGGACRAVVAGLKELGVPAIAVSNRTGGKAETLAAEFGVQHVPWSDRAFVGAELIVNASSLGMAGEHVNASRFPERVFTGKGLAYDIVYNPLETRFLKDARAAGWNTQDGLTMFVEQARESFRLWHPGKDLPFRQAAELVKNCLREQMHNKTVL
jgi:shikimate dehydrogenase